MDRLTPERRSWLMSRVPQKHSLPELRVRRAAHALGLRFRLHRRDLPGSPDIVVPKHHVALFVHGCFWHRHLGCPKTSVPKSRQEFWQAKFDRNVARDREVEGALIRLGWRVETLWECETRSVEEITRRLGTIFSISARSDVASPSQGSS